MKKPSFSPDQRRGVRDVLQVAEPQRDLRGGRPARATTAPMIAQPAASRATLAAASPVSTRFMVDLFRSSNSGLTGEKSTITWGIISETLRLSFFGQGYKPSSAARLRRPRQAPLAALVASAPGRLTPSTDLNLLPGRSAARPGWRGRRSWCRTRSRTWCSECLLSRQRQRRRVRDVRAGGPHVQGRRDAGVRAEIDRHPLLARAPRPSCCSRPSATASGRRQRAPGPAIRARQGSRVVLARRHSTACWTGEWLTRAARRRTVT